MKHLIDKGKQLILYYLGQYMFILIDKTRHFIPMIRLEVASFRTIKLKRATAE